jgi:hypothetical protein
MARNLAREAALHRDESSGENMNNDVDMALEAEVARRAAASGIATRVGGDPSRIARLASRLYAGADALQRSRMLAGLLRPLGPLGLVAVASGAFAGLLTRGGGPTVDDVGRFSSQQVFELARFVDQVSPDALRQVANTVIANPYGLSTLGAAAAVLLAGALRSRAGGDEPTRAAPTPPR